MTTSAPQNAPQDATSPLAPIPDQLPAEWLDEATRDAGLGVSDKAEDLLVPTLTVLQQNSPQCDKRGKNCLKVPLYPSIQRVPACGSCHLRIEPRPQLLAASRCPCFAISLRRSVSGSRRSWRGAGQGSARKANAPSYFCLGCAGL